MPSATLAPPNDRHNPVSGISFRKVTQDDSQIKNGGPYSHGDVTALRNHYNVINGVKRASSDKRNEQSGVGAIRMRLKKGRAVGANRNGYVYDTRPEIPFYNNNGPLKAFPINNNATGNGAEKSIAAANANNSSLPSSASEPSDLTSMNDCSAEDVKISSPRPPLQRIHGRGQRQKQNLPPGLADPELPTVSSNGTQSTLPVDNVNGHDGTTEKMNGHSKITLTDSSDQSPPLKSALHKTTPGTKPAQPRTHKEAVTFAEYNLPPGMLDLHQECFTPGAKGCFQHEADIPLLISTDAAILKRRSSISKTKKIRVGTAQNDKKTKTKTNDDTPTMLRSRSSASQVFVQPDIQILKSCWNIILSFMGDDKSTLSKNRSLSSLVSPRKKHFMSTKKLWRKSSADAGLPRTPPSPLPSPKITADNTRHSMFVLPLDESSPKKSTPKPHSSSSSLTRSKNLPPSVSNLTIMEKVHFLVNVGLVLPYLRDEIYCLVMKQLVNNPSVISSALGWILFSLITGSFPPSEKILCHVEKFIDHHQHAWSKYCGDRLRRSVQNGPRTNPPCSLEIQAAKTAERILFPVICMDNSAMTVTVDPATTSKEMLTSMTGKSRIGDPFGYCIVLQSGKKIVNLGAGRFPVMDALSQVEIFAGRKFNKSPCRLYYRRDIFSPRDLFCASDDSPALRLTFYQVCGGVHTGEYFCNKAADLSLLVAHQYSVRFGVKNVDEKRVSKFCDKCLPQDVYKTDKKNWNRMVTNTILALGRKQVGSVNPIDIMSQVIQYAMQNLDTHFVRTYSIMTFAKIGGVCTYTSDLFLSLSHRGVTVRQGQGVKVSDRSNSDEQGVVTVPIVLMEIPAANLRRVKLEAMRPGGGATLTVMDCIGGSYEITSAHGPEIYAVLFRYIRDITTGADKESKA